MPSFNFKLNVSKWHEWMLKSSNTDHSHVEPKLTVTVEAEDSEDAIKYLGMVVDHTNFDLQD